MQDGINHSRWYNMGTIEVIDFLEDQQLDYHLASAVAYICRAAHKGQEIQDLHKAVWYLQRKIALISQRAEAAMQRVGQGAITVGHGGSPS